jgi:DHA3 family macrolide efflux protein-like MFS transporter
VSIFTAAFTPYVLARGSALLLGLSLGLQGAGMFFTGMAIARHRRRGGSADHERRVLLGSLAFGACMLAWGVSGSAGTLCTVAFALGAMTSLIMASSQTIWQTHVPAPIQGKVFAVRTVLSFGLAPLSMLLSVPLAGAVFEPLLHKSAVAQSVWGAGNGAALGLMVSSLGIVVAACAAVLMLRGGLRLEAAPSTARTGAPA